MARTIAKVRGAEAATVVTRRSNRSTTTPTRFAYPTSERMSRARSGETLEQCVLRSLDQYFTDLDGSRPHALYEMVIHAVERPLLEFAMARAEGINVSPLSCLESIATLCARSCSSIACYEKPSQKLLRVPILALRCSP